MAGIPPQIADLTTSASISALGTGVLPANVTASGAGVVVLASKTGRSNWKIQLSALPAGMTLNFAFSLDNGVTYHAFSGSQFGGNGTIVSSTTSANNIAGESNSQVWVGMAAGVTHIAVWCSAYTSGSVTVTIVASAATQHVAHHGSLPVGTNSIGQVTANAGTNLNTSALALEAGHIASVDTKTPALGQALAAASVPVVLPAAQITSLTPPANVGITGTAAISQQAATLANATLQTAAAATGAGTTMTVTGYSAVVFTITGTFVGTVTFQGSEDGTNFSALSAVQLGTNTISPTATGPGTYEAACSGLTKVQANITAYTSGTITVTAHASPVAYNGKVSNVNVVSGGGGGTQYAEGTTALTATGTVSLATDAADVLHALEVDGSGNLLVNVAAGGTSGTQYADGATQATPTGTVAMGKDPSNLIHALPLDASGFLKVNVAAGGAGGGAVTVADGANVAQGTTTDAAYTTGAGTLVAILKGIFTRLRGGTATSANSLPVVMASDQAAVATKSGHLELTGLSSTGTGTPLVSSQDCLGYRSICVQIFGSFVGTVGFQQSNDNANWSTLPLISSTVVVGTGTVTSAQNVGMWSGPIVARYLRLAVTAYTSGTIQAVVELDAMPFPVQAVMATATESGNWSVATQSVKAANQTFNGLQTVASLDTSLGTITNHVTKASLGNVFAVYATNANAATRYFQLFNKASAPTSTTEVPVYSFVLPAGSATAQTSIKVDEAFFGQAGHMFATGVAWGISTTPAVFTDSATAGDHLVHVHWI